MNEVVDLNARARVRKLSWFVPTTTTGAITRIFDLCEATHTTGLVVGLPGCGKTAAARAHVAEKPHARLITMGTRVSTELAALGLILERLCGEHEAPPARAATDLHRMILKALRFGPSAFLFAESHLTEGEGVRLLLIDEAHSISQSAADCIRDLADEVKVAVCFAPARRSHHGRPDVRPQPVNVNERRFRMNDRLIKKQALRVVTRRQIADWRRSARRGRSSFGAPLLRRLESRWLARDVERLRALIQAGDDLKEIRRMKLTVAAGQVQLAEFSHRWCRPA